MKTFKDFPGLGALGYNNLTIPSINYLDNYRKIMEALKDGLDPSLDIEAVSHLNGNDGSLKTINKINVICFLQIMSRGFSPQKDKENRVLLLDLYKKGVIKQESINDLAFLIVSDFPNGNLVFRFLIENNMIDINLKTEDGRNFYYFAKTKTDFRSLKGFGCNKDDASFKADDSDKFETAYEIALRKNKKRWLSNLQSITNYEEKTKKSLIKLEEFKNEKDVTKLFNIIDESFMENNHFIYKELLENTEKYKKLCEYKNKDGLGVLHLAINNNNGYAFSMLIHNEAFKNRAQDVTSKGLCYASYALKNKRLDMTRYAYREGFCDKEAFAKELLDKLYNEKYVGIFRDINVAPKYKFALTFKYGNIESLKEMLPSLKKEEMDIFFKSHWYVMKSEVRFSGSSFRNKKVKLIYHKEDGENRSYQVDTAKYEYLFDILKHQEKIDNDEFNKNLKIWLSSIHQSRVNEGEFVLNKLLEFFPEKRKIVVENFFVPNDHDWGTKYKVILSKEILEDELSKSDERKVSKKLKI